MAVRKITVPYLIAAFLTHNTSVSKYLPDEVYLKAVYRGYIGKKLNLNNPITFNEKIQWLKLHDHNPQYTMMVDKIEVKKYVASIIGDEYIIPTLGVWNRFEDIDFEVLPKQFVLKCSHDSGGLVICRDKARFDWERAKKTINCSLNKNFYWYGREWPYKNVRPRILAEKYMEDKATRELIDYKFFTFDGTARILFIATERAANTETKFDFYDLGFNHLPIINGHPNAVIPPKKPKNFEDMIKLSEKLSKDISHLRVDFYEVDGRVYFGELTLSHWSGFTPFCPDSWDTKLGEWINLPKRGWEA